MNEEAGMDHLSSTLLIGAWAIVGATLLHVILNFFKGKQHALLKPPGPKGWPVLGHLPMLGAKPDKAIEAMVPKYGPMMSLRLGAMPAVILSSGSALAECVKAPDFNFSSRPKGSLDKYILHRPFGTEPYGPFWQDMRRIINCKVSGHALDTSRNEREEEAAELAHDLFSQGCGGGVAVELYPLVKKSTSNIMLRLMMGRCLLREEDGRDGEDLMKILEAIHDMLETFVVGDFLPWLSWIHLMGAHARMKSLRKRYDVLMDRMIAQRKKEMDSRTPGNDILGIMMDMIGQPVSKDGEVISEAEIKNLLLEMFIAGMDPSALNIEWGIVDLMRNPKILRAAQEEIDAVVGTRRLVLDTDLKNLPLVQAITKEIFRLHSAGPLSAPRKTVEDCEVKGYHIPKGTVVFLYLRPICTDPAVWPRPLEFWPQRFLPDGDNCVEKMKGSSFQYVPFGAGRRTCPGMNLGTRTVQLFIAMLVHAFDWQLPHGKSPEDLNMEKVGVVFPRRAEALVVHPIPRLERAAYQPQNTPFHL